MPRALRPKGTTRPPSAEDARPEPLPPFKRIHAVVARVPRGKVATYGQVARLAGRVTARLVGYAMAAIPEGVDLPWQRIINARGEVSPRKHGAGHLTQRRLLEREGVRFDVEGRVDLARHAWAPTPEPAARSRPARARPTRRMP